MLNIASTVPSVSELAYDWMRYELAETDSSAMLISPNPGMIRPAFNQPVLLNVV